MSSKPFSFQAEIAFLVLKGGPLLQSYSQLYTMGCLASNFASLLFAVLLVSASGSPEPAPPVPLLVFRSSNEENLDAECRRLLPRGVADDHHPAHGFPRDAQKARYKMLKEQELVKTSPVIAAELKWEKVREGLQ